MRSSSSEERSEIAFFDLETTTPSQEGQRHSILEFGAILVCPRTLVELKHYTTQIKPADLNSVPVASIRCAVASAPTFRQVSDEIYDILHGRVWAGHNIVKFDCVRIREAFAEIGKPAPHPKRTLDSWTLLTHTFGRRARDMKLASLGTYFGLPRQSHRSLADVRMNLQVLKNCAAILFLETNLPDIFPPYGWVPPISTARTHNTGRASLPNETNQRISPKVDEIMEERVILESPGTSCAPVSSEGCSGYAGFLAPEEISNLSITAAYVASFRGQKMHLLHKDVLFQLYSSGLIVRYGIRSTFYDKAGRPRLNIVVDIPASLCQVLDACDQVSQELFLESGSNSNWKPIVNRVNSSIPPTIRLKIPIVDNGDIYETEIYQQEASGNAQRLVFSKFDPGELDSLFLAGTLVEAYFSLDSYDYQQNVGFRLVAKTLIIHSG